MAKKPLVQDGSKTRHYLDVLRAVQKDTHSSGWYRGEVRGKEAIGAVTDALLRKGLIHAAVGPQPFRLTKKGKEFIAAHIKDWDALMAKIDQPGTMEKMTKALGRVAEQTS
jgi:hypothetical protein